VATGAAGDEDLPAIDDEVIAIAAGDVVMPATSDPASGSVIASEAIPATDRRICHCASAGAELEHRRVAISA
jgi:hypothetical protein